MDREPHFIGVDQILRYSAEHTLDLLKQELDIKLEELEAAWHYLSLETIFFENKVYRLLEKDVRTWDEQLDEVFTEMLKFQHLVHRPIIMEDIHKLVEKPVRKISRFDVKEVENKIAGLEEEMKDVKEKLNNLVNYTIDFFKNLKAKYGDKYPRQTEIDNFETIEATKVAVANAKLYVNKAEGFIGMDLKKDDDAEFVCECSDIDDIIVFLKNGKYVITKISDKAFVGKNILHAGVFLKNDERTIYNAVYRDGKPSADGKTGITFVKRFAVTGVTRDKEYDITQGKPESQVLWFSANSNGEAEILKIFLKPRPKLKKLILDFDFASINVKGRGSMGNILTKNPLHKIQLKSKGVSTIGGKSIWFDNDIHRLNEDGRGNLLGEFNNGDQILAICKDGTYYTTNYDLSNRYQGDILKVEKLDTSRTYCAIYFDREMGSYYIKRFSFEPSLNTINLFISDASGSYLVELSEDLYPQVLIKFGGKHSKREDEFIDAEEFIGKKGYKAKGKRATTYEVSEIKFAEPLNKENGEHGQGEEDNDINGTEDLDVNIDNKDEGFAPGDTAVFTPDDDPDSPTLRSEERRVGKEC